ncbi:hypothetical protein [Chryseobacterium terrae]|uniref:LysM domain-containing protein n=1 Tax=Chryseobacterium terrae TaxID=3163299 RepID=A0ABW8Y4E8_9FLAO
MNFTKYRIEQEDTLESISEKQKINIKDLIDFHNSHNTITQSIIGNYLPIHLEYIYLPLDSSIKKEETIDTNLKEFGKKLRYRCEQVNTSKINGSLAHFLQQNFQYVVKKEGLKNSFFVGLEDHHFDFNPTYLNPSFSFISKTEFIKNQVVFNISEEDGRIKKVINKEEIHDKWEQFKIDKFHNDDFIIQLKKTNEHAVQELLNMGDRQFAVNYELTEEEYRRNLFYFILFDKLLVDSIENIEREQFDFMSTLVPPIVIHIEFRYDKISQDDNILKFRKVGKAILNDELISEIKNKYDEIHKPNIKYNYTEYKLEFRVRGEFNLDTNIMENADLFIIEQIADNIENHCEFHLKKLQNHTS